MHGDGEDWTELSYFGKKVSGKVVLSKRQKEHKALKDCNRAEFWYLKRKAKGPIHLMNAFEIIDVISIWTKSLDWFLFSLTSQN